MKFFAVLVLVLCTLCGCRAKDNALEQATDLRKNLLAADGCSFQASITADYEDNVHTFQMTCSIDSNGKLNFIVNAPETISGISGWISHDGANLTFEDKVLAFPMLADGQISPVYSPWLFMNSMRGGYLSGCSEESDGLCIYIDDSFCDHPLKVEVNTDHDAIPTHVELIWQNRRILSLDIQNFVIL